jgi:hypothetical protein
MGFPVVGFSAIDERDVDEEFRDAALEPAAELEVRGVEVCEMEDFRVLERVVAIVVDG